MLPYINSSSPASGASGRGFSEAIAPGIVASGFSQAVNYGTMKQYNEEGSKER
jgi:hypothetical protein